ncbi:hypothetical protein EUGRSUZ_H00561 [Eucalyptus grandis]|uniref:Uncharacterized protein n=2 Tax=Eucalyptus grandis TaxID=71139 RepID=A0ACC3JP46_EUCGR|nr:hypothetical protein EUGRSUZ_H00561 [Eucalyptus grandis]
MHSNILLVISKSRYPINERLLYTTHKQIISNKFPKNKRQSLLFSNFCKIRGLQRYIHLEKQFRTLMSL